MRYLLRPVQPLFYSASLRASSNTSALHYCLSISVCSYRYKVKVKLKKYGRQDGQPSQGHRKKGKTEKEECPATEQDRKNKKKRHNIESKQRLQLCRREEHLQWDSSRHSHLQYVHSAVKMLPTIHLPYLQSHYWINDPIQGCCKASSVVIPPI